jgi:hypothetical protein
LHFINCHGGFVKHQDITEGVLMNHMCKKAILAAVFLLPFSASVQANDLSCPGNATPVMGDNGVECPATELPEPASPLLFLAAAGVAVVARKFRNKK